MKLTITSYAQTPSSLTVSDGTSTPPYALIADSLDWGNSNFQHTYSAPRGTLGSRPAQGIPQNRQVTLPIRVYGTTKDVLATNIRNLGDVIDDLRQFGGRLTWQSNSQSYRQHIEVLGTDGANVTGWSNRAENKNIAEVLIALSCAPYASGDPMDVSDTAFTTLATDYTFDQGVVGDCTASSGFTLTSNSTTSHRIIRSKEGYTLGDVEVTLNVAYARVNNLREGVIFWRTDANNYWTAHLEDDGSSTCALKINQTTAGSTTNRAAAFPTRPANAASVWVRVRTEGTLITAELWSSSPTPMGTPTGSTTYTAGTAGSGLAGIYFNPQSSTPAVTGFTVRPFTYSSRALPAKISLTGTVPGDALALGQLEVTTKQSLAWLMAGWQAQASASTISGAKAAFTVWNGDDYATRSNWGTTDSTAHTIYTSTAANGTTYSAEWKLDPSLLPTDAYADGDRAVEVWSLVITDSSTDLVAPTIVASVKPAAGNGPTRYTDEYGSLGIVVPTAAAAFSSPPCYRWARLGTVHLPTAGVREMRLALTGTVGVGSTGSGYFGIARVVLVPVRQRVCLPTRKDGTQSTYPAWSTSTTETVKTVDSDLTTFAYQPSISTVPFGERSVGGTPVELPTGNVDLLVAASALVPDDSTVSSSTEYLATGAIDATHVPQAALHVSVIPRFGQLR